MLPLSQMWIQIELQLEIGRTQFQLLLMRIGAAAVLICKPKIHSEFSSWISAAVTALFINSS